MHIQLFDRRPFPPASFSRAAASKIRSGPSCSGGELMGEFSDGENRQSAIAEIESATKSILQARQQTVGGEVSSRPLRYNGEYPVADLLGRCFLRVCFWADLFSSWTRRGRPLQLPHSAVPHSAVAAIEDTSALPVTPNSSASSLGGTVIS